MKTRRNLLICTSTIACVATLWAQEKTPAPVPAPARAAEPARPAAVAPERQAPDAELMQARLRMRDIEQGLYAVRQRLGLNNRDRASIKDAELLQLVEAAEKARKAMEEKGNDLIKADAEGAAVFSQIDELQKKADELKAQRRDLEKKLVAVAQRLGLEPARVERGAAPAQPAAMDPAFSALRTTAELARKAVEDKILERIKSDPEGGKLMQEREQLVAKFQAGRDRVQERKPEPKP